MKQTSFYQYLPQRFVAVTEAQEKVRRFIYHFKDGDRDAARYAADKVVAHLLQQYGRGADVTLACVPASCIKTYMNRFALFSYIVAKRTRSDNALHHVSIYGIRRQLHNTSDHVAQEADNYRVQLDEDFFRGRKVVIFDDLTTTGRSAEQFAAMLAKAGAEVVGALFLAQTVRGIERQGKFGKFAEHTRQLVKRYSQRTVGNRQDYRAEVHALCQQGKRAAELRQVADRLTAIAAAPAVLCLPAPAQEQPTPKAKTAARRPRKAATKRTATHRTHKSKTVCDVITTCADK